MAHVLKIIPNGFRSGKKIQILSCMKNDANNIQQRIDCAAKVKQQLERDVFEQENKIKQSAEAAKLI